MHHLRHMQLEQRSEAPTRMDKQVTLMTGRKLTLTEDLKINICRILEDGTTVKDACAIVGIGQSTYFEWVAIGNAYRNGENHERMPKRIADREMFAEFAEATTRARAKMRHDIVKVLGARARAGDVPAATFLLERSDPEQWGKRTYSKIEGLDDLEKAAKKAGIPLSEALKALAEELSSDA